MLLRFEPAEEFAFCDMVAWPAEIGNYSAAVEEVIREVLSKHDALHTTSVTLESAQFHSVNSCESGFKIAARFAVESAFQA